jgi:lysosomal-associated membrane protein 1/2
MLKSDRFWTELTVHGVARMEAFREGTNSSWYDPVQHCEGDLTTTEAPTTTPTTTETTTTPTTTTTETTTTTASTTTPAPGPKAKWSLNDTITGYQCVLASFTGKFLVAYDFTNPAKQTASTNASVMIPDTGVSVDPIGSTCSGYTLGTYNQLRLTWMNGAYPYALTLLFNLTNTGVRQLSEMWLDYSLNDSAVFHNAVEGAGWYRMAKYMGPKPVATINDGTYLKCDSGTPLPEMFETIDNKTVWGDLTELKLEAFRMSKTDTFDDNADVCPGDEVTTTPYPVTTSASPPINVANYTVLQNGLPCLTALFSMDLAVVWWNTSMKDTNSSWAALNNATVNKARSMCTNDTAVLAIEEFIHGWTFLFYFTHNNDHFALSEIRLDFNLSNALNFPNANFTGNQMSHTNGLNAFSTTISKHYLCKVPTVWKLNTTDTQGIREIDLRLEQVQVEAFMVEGNWGPVEECAADNGGGGDTSEIVPIAVGCALAASVIIVLIAYVIGRRRNRARGYESM